MSEQLQDLISRADQILLIAHADPDGDTVGSALGLSYVLTRMGKNCSLACVDAIPEALSFLPGIEEFGTPAVAGQDLIITVDASDPNRLGRPYRHVPSLRIPVVNLDHHITNSMFGSLNLVRTEAAATAEIVFDLLQDWRFPLDALLATYLLTGIVTDTRSFSTPTTTPRVLEIATHLMTAGASLTEINENYYNKRNAATLRLWGRMLDSMQLDGQLVWSVNTLEMQDQCRARSDDGDGIVNLLATASEAKAAIVFKEKGKQRVEISIRSRPGVDIAPIAVYFGGGGHPQAAGSVLEGTLEQVIPKVLTKANEILNAGG